MTARSCSIRSAPSTGSASRSSGARSRARCTRAASTSGSTPTSRWSAACTRATRRNSGPSTRPGHTGSAAPRRGVFAGTLAAADRRLAQAVVTLREQVPAAGFVNAHPMAHHRWLPSIEKGAPDALDELIRSRSASFEGGPAWRGDATLSLFESPSEELARLEVREIIAGYYQQVGVSWDGGTVLAERTS